MKIYKEVPHRFPKVVSEYINPLIAGKAVCELGCAEGYNMVFMDLFASEQSSGIYFVRLIADEYMDTQKLMHIK